MVRNLPDLDNLKIIFTVFLLFLYFFIVYKRLLIVKTRVKLLVCF